MAGIIDPELDERLRRRASFRNTVSPGNTLPQPMTPIQGSSVAADISPAVRVVDQPKETVRGQLMGILDEKGPFIQQAETAAKQEYNARGLLNSSMAISAGQDAAYRAALPVANADAQVYRGAGDLNFGTQNQFALSKLGTQQQSRLQHEAAIHELNKSSALQEQAAHNERLLQQMKGGQATELANIEARYKNLMQANDSAARTFAQISQNIQVTMNDPNISPENKQTIISRQVQLLRSGLAVVGGIANLDLAGLLQFS